MIDRLLFERFRLSVTAQSLFRVLFAVGVIGMRQNRVAVSLSAIPRELLLPPLGPAQLLSIPSPLVLEAANCLVGALCWLLLFGFHTRFVSLFLAALLVITRAWEYSLGKVDHHILFILVPACLAFSRWGEALSVDALRNKQQSKRDDDRDAWPFALLAILVALGMFGSGLQKAIGGWLDPGTPATVGWIVYLGEAWNHSPLGFRHIDRLLALHPAVLESLDWAPVCLELLFPIGLVNRRLFQVLCCAAALFHVGTFFIMGIYFNHQALAYAAFFDWGRAAASVRRAFSLVPGWLSAPAEVLAASAVVGWLVVRPLPKQPTMVMLAIGAIALVGLLVAIRDTALGDVTSRT